MGSSHFRSKEERHEVGRYLARLLRVDAHEKCLAPDRFGRVPISRVLAVAKEEFPVVTRGHVEEIVAKDPQSRFELTGELLRARTGHRYKVDIPFAPCKPPPDLYHGTARDVMEKILEEGIDPKGKSFVHLSSTVERAHVVGRRKDESPVVLRIEALRAQLKGIRFWRSGQVSSDGEVYLSDPIPAEFVCLWEE